MLKLVQHASPALDAFPADNPLEPCLAKHHLSHPGHFLLYDLLVLLGGAAKGFRCTLHIRSAEPFSPDAHFVRVNKMDPAQALGPRKSKKSGDRSGRERGRLAYSNALQLWKGVRKERRDQERGGRRREDERDGEGNIGE